MVVFLHEGFSASKWCDQEVGFALACRVPVLPISIDLVPYGFLGRFQTLKAKYKRAQEVADGIIDWLVETPSAQEAMTEGLVTALVGSQSYHRTRRLMALLEKLPRFTPEQLTRLDTAARKNNQVSEAVVGASMAPKLIQQLIAKHGVSAYVEEPF